jgi:uncharacterized protein
MTTTPSRRITIALPDGQRVSGLLQTPPKARAGYVLAHGAGAGMTHPFMTAIADGLAERGIATFRFQFLYMEKGGRRPDPPALAHLVVRAAIAEARRRLPRLPLFAGGRSFGGRMTSQAQAVEPLPGVRGLIFLGFPLHPAGRPSIDRAGHLREVEVPLLFIQGTRDALAETRLLRPVVKKLGARATLHLLPEADHAFHVPVRTGRSDSELRTEILDAVADWINRKAAERPRGRP